MSRGVGEEGRMGGARGGGRGARGEHNQRGAGDRKLSLIHI